MALLQDIISAATSEKQDAPSLLRKALVLATRLRNDELKSWVSSELNGYTDESSVPEYRRTEVISYGFFADRYVGQATLQIPLVVLPKEFREKYRRVTMQNPINALIDLLDRSKEKDINITLPWPPAALRFAQKVSEIQCISAWRALNPSFVAGIVDTVKTRILSMALDLEDADPTAGEVPSTRDPLSEAKMSQIITTHIHGTVQNFSAGGDNVTQTATLSINPGDKASLLRALDLGGVPAEDIKELSVAIDADEVDNSNLQIAGMGERVKAWLGNLHLKAIQHLPGITSDVVAGLVTQCLLLYFNLAI